MSSISNQDIDAVLDDVRRVWRENPHMGVAQIVATAAMFGGYPSRDFYYATNDQIRLGLRSNWPGVHWRDEDDRINAERDQRRCTFGAA